MIVVGLTGSIAMGKSEVARIFQNAGIPVFDADQEVHALYDSDKGVSMIRSLVPAALSPKGTVDREKLAKLVIENGKLLEQIEHQVHAEVDRRREAFLAQARKDGREIVVVDIPLLFEKGLEKQVDFSIVVSAPEATQKRRAMSRKAMTAEKLDMILARQMPDAEKRRRADYVIENDGTLSQLREKCLALLHVIRRRGGLCSVK